MVSVLKKGRPLGGSKCKYLFKPERSHILRACEWMTRRNVFFFSLKSPPSQESKERKAERPFNLYLYLQGRRNFVLVYRCRGVSLSCSTQNFEGNGYCSHDVWSRSPPIQLLKRNHCFKSWKVIQYAVEHLSYQNEMKDAKGTSINDVQWFSIYLPTLFHPITSD